MDQKTYVQALRHMPEGRDRFAYFKDRYALKLLEYAFEDGTPLKRVKASAFGSLLRHGPSGRAIARCGDGNLSHAALLGAWPQDYEVFWLSLGCWSPDYYRRGYAQTSRPGCNLVLQLCFSSRHDRPYRRYVRPASGLDPFQFRGHPVAHRGLTLAWARLDIDLDGGEALIEEIQSDWVRAAHAATDAIGEGQASRPFRNVVWGRVDGRVRQEDIQRYLDRVLWRYDKLWDEAMLCATVEFLRERLGVRTIYYHSPESCRLFKDPVQGDPPRSLYTRLPRRFCFQRTDKPPRLLRSCQERFVRRLVRQADVTWHVLTL